ncbi:class I adenylate-forming enzyme family protein [Haliea sp. E17]|uniref:class I adenylate-forming enzyme family protein n=1 Tax=Haliea sp. E17 TaxID=3401576 RepID=UPI003AAEFB15
MTTLSEFSGIPLAEETGIGSLTLGGFAREVSGRFTEHEAICWRNLSGKMFRYSYREFYAECRNIASALLALGVSRGTRVGILASNRPEWLFCVFGASMAGATTVALNTFSPQRELKLQLEIADVSILLMEAGVGSRNFIEEISGIVPGLGEYAPGELLTPELPFLRRVVCIDATEGAPGIQSWADFRAAGASISDALLDAADDCVSPADDALIFFSSGSTAQPKAIRQSQRAASLQCWRCGKMFDLDTESRVWNANGFFFSGNFAMAFGTLARGGCMVLLRYFDPDRALELIEQERVTCVLAWPHQEARLKECPDWEARDFSSVKRMVADSAFHDHPTVTSQWKGMNGYGSTETFTFVAAVSGEDYNETNQGTVWPGNTIRIVDPETGETLPIGETGEIVVKGPTLMLGYLKSVSEDCFDREGFFHTADAGYFSESGHLYWKGRLSDMIKTGGANVSPAEINEILNQHPAVQYCHTVGVPDPTFGELVVACVLLREGAEVEVSDIQSFARERLASYKVPRKVLFFDESEMPLTGSNKVKLADLRTLAANRLANG